MKIAFIDWMCNPLRPGVSGLSDIIWAIASRLVQSGDDVHVVAPYRPALAPFGGVHVHQQYVAWPGYRNIIGHVLLASTAWAKVRSIPGVRIVHSAEYVSTAVASIANKNHSIVLTTPGNIYERINNVNHFDASTTAVYKAAARMTAKNAVKIIATSDEMRKWWVYSGANENNINTIPLGVDTKVFYRYKNAKAILGLDERKSVLFIGRLQSENGARYLIEAIPILVEKMKDVAIDIVGDGPDKERLVELAHDLGVDKYIRWHGLVKLEQLPLYYSAADIFVLPRISRVTPRVIFESMACGTPVVTSRIGGIIDFIVDGTTGFLVEPKQVRPLAEKIILALSNKDLLKVVSEKSREYACEELDWDHVVARMRSKVYAPLNG